MSGKCVICGKVFENYNKIGSYGVCCSKKCFDKWVLEGVNEGVKSDISDGVNDE